MMQLSSRESPVRGNSKASRKYDYSHIPVCYKLLSYSYMPWTLLMLIEVLKTVVYCKVLIVIVCHFSFSLK